MSNPREQQFQQFGKLVWAEIMEKVGEELQNIEAGEDVFPDKVYSDIIARRAFDLTENGMKYLHDWMPDISDIPDMTALPKEDTDA